MISILHFLPFSFFHPNSEDLYLFPFLKDNLYSSISV